MSKIGSLLILASFLFAACAPVTSPDIVPTRFEIATNTSRPDLTTTPTPLPTSTSEPILTATITPFAVEKVQPHPLALNPSNAATGMKKLREVGKGYAEDVAWSPDGKTLAVSSSSGIYFYDTQTWKKEDRFINEDRVNKITYSKDGNFLGYSTLDEIIYIFDVQKEQLINTIKPQKGFITKLKFTSNGYITAEIHGETKDGSDLRYRGIWNATSGKTIFQQEGTYSDYKYNETDVNSSGTQILFWENKYIQNIESGKLLPINSTYRSGPHDGVDPVSFSQDDQTVLVGNPVEEELVIWDSANESLLKVRNCDNIESGNKYAVCYGNSTLTIIDILNRKIIHQHEFSRSTVSAAFNATENRLAISIEGTVAILDIDAAQYLNPVVDFGYYDHMATGIINLNGGKRILIATTSEGNIQIWDSETSALVQTFYQNNSIIESVDFSPDQHTLASINFEGVVTLWDISTGKQTHEFDLARKSRGPIKFNPDGTKLALLDSEQRNILELDIQTGDIRTVNQNPSSYFDVGTPIYCPFLYTQDGHLIIWGYKPNGDSLYDLPLQLLDLTTNDTIELPFIAHSDFDFVESMALSPDENWLALGTPSGNLYVFNAHNQKLTQTLRGHGFQHADGWVGAIKHIEFSPTSNLLVSTGYDGTTRLWNIETGNPLRIINRSGTVRFTPDGKYLVIGGDTLSIWGIPEP